MTAAGWWCVEAAAELLEPREREVVLGDLAEAGDGLWPGLAGVGGLAVRRQLAAWANWRPWLAGFGLAWPGSLFLMGFSLSVSHGLERLMAGPMPSEEQGGTLLLRVVLLAAWAWTGGFVAASLSRRTLWASAFLCCLPCCYCMSEFPGGPIASWGLFLFVLPAVWGVRMALSGLRLRRGVAVGLALVVAASAPMAMRGSWWLYAQAMVWPALYLAMKERKWLT